MRFLICGAARRPTHFVALLFALLALLVVAQCAAAGPPGPTMDLQDLETALQSGPLDGYLLSTMKGTTPEQIPVQVQSLVDYPWGSLILFEASGPWIDRIGGIAAGMSGSPVYVDDGGAGKLIGAVSYGDTFTLRGLGLATPIQYMTAIEEAFPVGALAALQGTRPPAAGSYPLDAPVTTSDGVLTSVRIARSSAAAATVEAASGQAVMTPLALLEIGGVRPDSAAFERIAAKFEKSGLLVKAAPGDGRWAGAPAPTLEAGSPCAILFSQGAVWVGAAGTVTYVDGDAAMIFGHPFQQFGAIDAALTAGDVRGIWASGNVPYKLVTPLDIKGTCVQDRNWGVEADLGRHPDLFSVTTTAAVVDRGLRAHDASAASEWLFTGNAYPTLPADITSQVAYGAVDQASYPGSAVTTTSVVVSDTTGTYTITHDNLWSDPSDVLWPLGWDVADILSRLSADPDGIIDARVESTDVTAAISPAQRSARIAGVTLPDGIHEGETTAVVQYYRYGSAEPQMVVAHLNIPEGTPLSGRVTVQPAAGGPAGGGESDDPFFTDTGPPQTLADLVDELNAMPRNSDLLVSYQPGEGGEGESAAGAIDTVAPTDWVQSGYFSASTPLVMLEARPRTVPYGGSVRLTGQVGSGGEVAVDIYRRYAGSAATVKVAAATAVARDGMAAFGTAVTGLKKNATLVARTVPVDGMLRGSASVTVRVSAKVWLSGGAKLAVHVRPVDADGTARLQRRRNGTWTDYKSVKIVDGEGHTRLLKGTYSLRARFTGSDLCAPGISRPFTVTVK